MRMHGKAGPSAPAHGGFGLRFLFLESLYTSISTQNNSYGKTAIHTVSAAQLPSKMKKRF